MTAAKPSNKIKSAVVQKTQITLSFEDGKTCSLDSTHESFKKVKAAVREKNGGKSRKLIDAAEAIGQWSEGKLTIDRNDNVLYAGKIVHPAMHKRLLRMVREGVSVTRFVMFLENLYQNPNAEAISDLYEFLEHNDLPLTEDGHFLAFKKITKDWKDCYSRTFDYSLGQRPKMRREDCDPRRNVTCSHGLHFARWGYFGQGFYQGAEYRLILVKVNPRDVTAIPREYGNAKGRCCEFESVTEVPDSNVKALLEQFEKRSTVRVVEAQKTAGMTTEARKAVKKVATAVKKAAKKAAKAVKKAVSKKGAKRSAAKKTAAKKTAKNKGVTNKKAAKKSSKKVVKKRK